MFTDLLLQLIHTEYLCHEYPRICTVFRNYNPVISSFITYQRVCSKSNVAGVIYV